MAAKRFKSKVDRWIFAVLVFALVAQAVALSAAALQSQDPLATTAFILVMIAVSGLMIWLMIGTHYTVDHNTLRIAAGPFRWKVPVDEITAVEATRSPLSSPAMSLDRLRLRYGRKNRCILISPADRDGFLRAIGHELNT